MTARTPRNLKNKAEKPRNIKGDGRAITPTKPDYETIRITPTAKDELIQAALRISVSMGRRVSLTELASALLTQHTRNKTDEELIEYVQQYGKAQG